MEAHRMAGAFVRTEPMSFTSVCVSLPLTCQEDLEQRPEGKERVSGADA